MVAGLTTGLKTAEKIHHIFLFLMVRMVAGYHIFFSISIHNGDQGLTKVFLMLKYSNGMPYSLIRFPPKFLVWSVCFGPSHVIDRWTLVHPVCVSDQPPLSTTTTRSRRFYKLMHGRLYVSDTFTNFVRSNARA